MTNDQINPAVTYDAIFDDIKTQATNLKAMQKAYVESGEITVEELNEVYPELQDDINFYDGVAKRLSDTKTRDWFIENMEAEIKAKISDDQLAVILEGLGYLTEIETILIGGTKDLLEFVAPGGENKNTLN